MNSFVELSWERVNKPYFITLMTVREVEECKGQETSSAKKVEENTQNKQSGEVKRPHI